LGRCLCERAEVRGKVAMVGDFVICGKGWDEADGVGEARRSTTDSGFKSRVLVVGFGYSCAARLATDPESKRRHWLRALTPVVVSGVGSSKVCLFCGDQ
jgi:hypothetical protein